jgi:hypothetical protein
MKVPIQVSAEDDAKAWGILVRHSPGKALPNRVFIISEEAVKALRKAKIRFSILPSNAIAAEAEGIVLGERI